MAPRLIDARRCPHCGAELPEETPRVCPECMGSLQQRYLRAGCLSSKPVLVLFALGLWQALAGGPGAEAARPAPGAAEGGPAAGAAAEERPARERDRGRTEGGDGKPAAAGPRRGGEDVF